MIRNPIFGNGLEQGVGLQNITTMSNNKLYVGNLSFNTTENDLQDLFAAHGTVIEANLMMDRMSGRPRGFGFVTMSTPKEPEPRLAPSMANQLAVGPLRLKVPKPPETEAARGGG